MKLEIYVCDNCKCSVNKTDVSYYDFFYLHLCPDCKEKFDECYNRNKNLMKEVKEKYINEVKENFPNIYERIK